MYYGKMTAELEKLYEEYEHVFGYEPDGVEQLEYAAEDYDKYVSDIKQSIEKHIHIADLHPSPENMF